MKKILLLTLVIIFVLSMMSISVGCKTETAETTAAATTAAETTAAETEKVAKETVLGYTPLTFEIAYFQDVNKGIQKGVEKFGVKVILDDPQMDPGKQITGVENMIAAGANVISICSIDVPSAQSAVKYAHEKDIPVISHISAFKDADVYIRLDEYNYGFAAGEAGAKYILENMDGKAKVAILDADSLGGDLLLRSKGMIEGVLSAGDGVEIVARVTAFEEETALAAMENILQEHPDVNFVVTSNEPGAYGALAAAESAGKDIKISAIGSEDRQCDLITQGKIVSGIDPSPLWTGMTMVEIAKKIVSGEAYEKEYFVPFRQVTMENAQTFKDERK